MPAMRTDLKDEELVFIRETPPEQESSYISGEGSAFLDCLPIRVDQVPMKLTP